MERRDDYLEIADLVNRWLFRDTGRFEDLAGLFHPDAEIEVSWFKGAAADFIRASKERGAGGPGSKHLIGMPVVEFCGARAISETNVVIAIDRGPARLGCVQHGRFLDRVERRGGPWRLSKRVCVYDQGWLVGCGQPTEEERAIMAARPHLCAALAAALESLGASFGRELPVKGSALEQRLREEDLLWLGGGGA